jgi:hypothetical protein
MQAGYVRMFISWLRFIFRNITCRLYKTFLAVFRLFQRCRVVSGGIAGLALSSQPIKLTDSTTLAVPLLGVPLQSDGSQPGRSAQFPTPELVDEGLNAVTYNTQAPQNLVASSILTSITMPEPFIDPPAAPPYGVRTVLCQSHSNCTDRNQAI